MEQAKKMIHEIQDSFNNTDYLEESKDALQQSLDEDLKPDINNLLFQYLPDNITIRNAEILATVIYNIIRFPEDFLKK